MRIRVIMVWLVLMTFFVPTGHGFMESFGPDDRMPSPPGSSNEMKKLFEGDARVSGSVGPIVDTLISCSGDTEKLNEFIEIYASLTDSRLKIVLHPGSKTSNYKTDVFDSNGDFKGQEPHFFELNWLLRCTWAAIHEEDKIAFEGKKFLTQLDIWLGGQIDFGKLKIPSNVPLVSSNELEGFIDRHETERKQQDENERQ